MSSPVNNDIAIVGIGLRFPQASTPETFWRNIVAGHESVERSGGDGPWVRSGAWLDRIEQFDPAFFGISVAEAELMDPQHRIFA